VIYSYYVLYWSLEIILLNALSVIKPVEVTHLFNPPQSLLFLSVNVLKGLVSISKGLNFCLHLSIATQYSVALSQIVLCWCTVVQTIIATSPLLVKTNIWTKRRRKTSECPNFKTAFNLKSTGFSQHFLSNGSNTIISTFYYVNIWP